MINKKYVIPNNDLHYPTEEAFRLVNNIDWKSVDKDNMEFETRVTCFQKDALEAVIAFAVGMY